jgi:AcrR family transcriptional regulator
MSSRDTSAMADRILRTADRLFYSEGIRAIGVDRVAAEAGISKRTLYNHYPSKDALIVAYLQRRARPLVLTGAAPAGQILAMFDGLEQAFANARFRGCPFVNAVAELGEPDHPAHPIAKAFKQERKDSLQSLTARLDCPDPGELAAQLALLLDGAIVGALVSGDAAVARTARRAAETLLNAAASPVRAP